MPPASGPHRGHRVSAGRCQTQLCTEAQCLTGLSCGLLGSHTSLKDIPGLRRGAHVPGSPEQSWAQRVHRAPGVWGAACRTRPTRKPGRLVPLGRDPRRSPEAGPELGAQARMPMGTAVAGRTQPRAEGGGSERQGRTECCGEGRAQLRVLQMAFVFHAAILKPGEQGNNGPPPSPALRTAASPGPAVGPGSGGAGRSTPGR